MPFRFRDRDVLDRCGDSTRIEHSPGLDRRADLRSQFLQALRRLRQFAGTIDVGRRVDADQLVQSEEAIEADAESCQWRGAFATQDREPCVDRC